MSCRIFDLRQKEVINLKNGCRLGFISDVEINLENGRLSAIVLNGPPRFFGLLGHDEDIVIEYKDIERIGEDIIFVNFEYIVPYEPKRKWFR